MKYYDEIKYNTTVILFLNNNYGNLYSNLLNVGSISSQENRL